MVASTHTSAGLWSSWLQQLLEAESALRAALFLGPDSDRWRRLLMQTVDADCLMAPSHQPVFVSSSAEPSPPTTAAATGRWSESKPL